MLFGLLLAFCTYNSTFHLCLVLSILFSLLPLSSLFNGDVELVNLADLAIQLSSYLSHQWHIWGYFFSLSLSLPDTSPKLDKLFHFWHLSWVCFLYFQRSKESLLVPLEHDIILLSSPFFFTFCQLYLFVPQLVQTLLSGIPQIVISCIFIDQDSQFLDDLLFILSCFSPFSPSIQLIARFCDNLISFFNFRSRLFPPFALFFFLSPLSLSTNFPDFKPIALPIAYTLSQISGMVSISFRYISNTWFGLSFN